MNRGNQNTMERTAELSEAQQLSALYSVATLVNQSLDIEFVLRNVMRKIQEIFAFDAARIYLLDRDGKELCLLAHQGFRKGIISNNSYKSGEGIIGKVFETGKPLLFEDIQNDLEFNRLSSKKTLLREGFRGSFFIPIKVKDTNVGVMNFVSKTPHRFSSSESQLVESIAYHLGAAVHNARLYEQIKDQAVELEKTNKDLQRREDIQKLLKELSQDITSLDIDRLLNKLTAKACETLKADVVDVRVLEGEEWQVKGSFGISPGDLSTPHTMGLRGRMGWIVKNRRPLSVPDLTRDDGIPSGENSKKSGIRGYLGVPLLSREGVAIGVLRALTYQPRDFSQDEIDLLQQLGHGAAIAIENARLFEEVREKSHDLEATNLRLNRLLKEQSSLREIFAQVSLSDLDQLLHQLTEQALTLLRLDQIQVRLISEDGSLRTVALAGERVERYQDRLLKSKGKGRSRWVIENCKPLAIKDISQDKVFGPGNQLRRMGVKGYLLVPLISRGQKSIGVLGALSFTEREFTQEEIALAQQFASGVAIAIENASLYEQTKKQAVELERDIAERKRGEEALAEMALFAQLNPAPVLRLDHKGTVLLGNKAARKLFGDQDLSGKSWSSLCPGLESDCFQKLLCGQDNLQQEAHFGEKAFLFTYLGSVERGQIHVYGADITKVKQAEEELKALNESLEQRVAERTVELSNSNRALESEITERKRAQEEIGLKNRDLETLLYVTSHDLREPLRAIESFSRMVNDRYVKEIDEKGRDFLMRVVRGAGRMTQLLDDILVLSRAQRTELQTEEIEGETIVREALEPLDRKINETGAKVQVARDLPHLRVDRMWGTQAVYNLVANALKFTRKGEVPELEIGPYQPNGEDPKVDGIVVRDRGPGLAPEHSERIFQLFQRGVGREIEGTGAGLAIVRQIAERHGGRAWTQRRQGGGSEFIITFARSETSEGDKA